jgi:NAD(P)-dependent dehydrogenase (short-subunit alcohol dehydrogenase family)
LNVTHPIRATQLAIDTFKRLRPKPTSGVVILISSIAAQMALLPTPMYSASKHAISGFVRSLGTLEAIGIRIVGVAPGIVKTPIWTAEKLDWVDEKVDKWVTTKEVAETMAKMIEDPEMVGGTILEIAVGSTRKVEELNDPGPGKEGHTVAKAADAFAKVFVNVEENFGKSQQNGK